MYLRQLHCLLYKNIIFKYRHKRQAVTEVISVLFFPVLVAVLLNVAKPIQTTYPAIPSSNQTIYNTAEIPGWETPHLAYVTNVNAS